MLCPVADVSGHDTWAWNSNVWYLWWNLRNIRTSS